MKPSPETKEVLLVAPGASEATLHFWVETRECTLPGPDGAAWEFIFECSKTGARQRYGCQDRAVHSWTGN